MTKARRVGWKGNDGGATESVGHASGRGSSRSCARPTDELTDEDYAHMRKVVGFIRRHRRSGPENIYTSRWRYSLMNWGHDPVKEDESEGLLRQYRKARRSTMRISAAFSTPATTSSWC